MSAAILLVGHASPVATPPSPRGAPPIPAVLSFDEERLAQLADRTVRHDPFRLDRRPADTPFGQSNLDAPPAAPRPPIPTIILKGIVGGPPWQAVLGGFPDRPGDAVVRAGDTLAGLRVRRVTPDHVVLAGPDSSITLTPYRAWP